MPVSCADGRAPPGWATNDLTLDCCPRNKLTAPQDAVLGARACPDGRGELRSPSHPDPHPAVVGQQDGVTLDVPVDHALGVEHRQGLQHGEAH